MVQGVFKVANKRFSNADAVDRSAELKIHGVLGRKTPDEIKDQVVRKIESLADDTADHGRFRSYKELVAFARNKISVEASASAPVIANRDFTFNPDRKRKRTADASQDTPPAYDTNQFDRPEKIRRLKEFRRSASPVANRVPEIAKFRDTSEMAEISYLGDRTQTFSIGHTGNFLLGGLAQHSYADLLKTLEDSTGWKSDRIADLLIAALSGQADAFEGLSGNALKAATKLVSLIHGPERRRAAFNTTAAIAALNTVRRGDSILHALNSSTLFALTDGGSQNSQYHRIVVPMATAIKQTAENEHDALMELAARNGVDVTDEDAVKTFVGQMTNASTRALQTMFAFGQRGTI